MPRQVVCLSVTMRYDYHIGWNITKIISWLISLESLLFADSDIVRLHQRKHYESDEILARIGTGGGLSAYELRYIER